MDETKIRGYLFELEELSNQILESLFIKDGLKNSYRDLVYKYRSIRAELFLELTDSRKLPRINDPQLRRELKDFIKKGSEMVSKFKSDEHEVFREIGAILEKDLQPEFSPEREKELEWDLFYAWFNPMDYVYGQIESALIVIKNLELPDQLEPLIYELRQCLVFQNYLAAGIMLRTIADVAVKDIMERNYPIEANEKDPKDKKNKKLLYSTFGERLSFLNKRSQFSQEATVLNAYRKDLNNYVHGNKLVNKRFVKQYVEIVLEQVERLYEKSD